MSADNCLYVSLTDKGEWGVSMEFMSTSEDEWGKRPRSTFRNVFEAVAAAHAWEEDEMVVEYGVLLSDDASAALADGPIGAAAPETSLGYQAKLEAMRTVLEELVTAVERHTQAVCDEPCDHDDCAHLLSKLSSAKAELGQEPLG